MSETSKLRPYLAAAIVNLPVFSIGLSVGWMSPAVPILQSNDTSFKSEAPFTDDQISWLGSLQFLGGVSGVLLCGKIAEIFGRKPAGYALSVPLIVGWLMVLFMRDFFWFALGRFVMGLSGTGSLVLAPLYVNEISEDSYRGELGSFIMLFFNFGVVAAYFIGSIASLTDLTIFCASIPFIFLITFYALPESPVFLWTKGKKEKAKGSLLWFRASDHKLVEKELSILDDVINTSEKKKKISFNRLYDSKGTIKGMTIGFALYVFQQFCGVLMLLTYTSQILIKSGLEFSAESATVFIGSVQLVGSWLSSLIIDRLDRKFLMIISNLGMFIALCVLALHFYIKEYYGNLLPNWIPFVFMSAHVISYTGSASMTYIITSEVLTPDIRPLAFSITSFCGTAMAFISVKIYSTLVHNFGMHGNFLFFAFWCLFAVFFTIFFIPETRGRSLVDVLRELNGIKVEEKSKNNVYNVNAYELTKTEEC